MKIIAPVNKFKEVESIIKAGADEIYCGILPDAWKKKYTNVASPNRREWTSANLTDFNELKKIVDIAHNSRVPVYLAVNAFYSQEQHILILDQIKRAKAIGVDAFIIGDLGLLLALKKNNLNIEVHISNTGTVFNCEAVRFYKELGASRIILCRHLMMEEIAILAESEKVIEFEVFIMNSGCKNIDGFCTFHHGVNEITHPYIWNFLKRLNFDRHLLNLVKKFPRFFSTGLKSNIAGIDSACLLDYKISLVSCGNNADKDEITAVSKAVFSGFSLLSGADPCGACDLHRFKKMGIHSLKIVGRNYSASKKIKDIKFLKKLLISLESSPFISEEEFKKLAKSGYRDIYKMDCNEFCYRFN